MDIETIEDEVAIFNDDYFGEILNIIDENFDFIDENNLREPKENYLLVFNFLNSTINHFTALDHAFMDGTLQKIYKDVNNLHNMYLTYKEHQENIEDLFKKGFLNKSKLFRQMKGNILKLRDSPTMDEEDRETVEIIKEHYKAMRGIYFDVFQNDYIDQSKEVISSLQKILNCKIFYLNTLLWIEAIESEAIWRSLKILRIDKGISSKKYLEYRLKVALPYTKDYVYMQKCLRIYR